MKKENDQKSFLASPCGLIPHHHSLAEGKLTIDYAEVVTLSTGDQLGQGI